MKSLANDQVKEGALRTLWMQRLPNQGQLFLSASQGVDLSKMADIADKIVEVSTGSALSIAAIAHAPPPHELSSLKAQISALTKMVEEMCVRGRSHSHSRNGSRYRKTRSTTTRLSV